MDINRIPAGGSLPDAVARKVQDINKIYIAGAHSRGRTLRKYLEFLYPDVRVEAFLVDDMSENANIVDGIPVLLIGKGLHVDYPVYIGTKGENHAKITRELKAAGMTEIIPVTVELDIFLRNKFIQKYFQNEGRKFQLIDDLNTEDECMYEKKMKIYVASSALDKPLQSDYKLIKDEVLLQVGAALTDKRIMPGVVTDFVGQNISDRNKQYCELTGLYWIWKNAQEDYVGLVHYRRHFLLPHDWLQRMITNNIDVILPVPLYVLPNIAENYMERHIASDWKFLMDYFKTELPDEYEDVERIFSGNLYSPCNMIIANKVVLDKMCSWLFPIVNAVAEHGGKRDDAYMNRYPGFISERLITYFFEKHINEYNLVYANKNFLN